MATPFLSGSHDGSAFSQPIGQVAAEHPVEQLLALGLAGGPRLVLRGPLLVRLLRRARRPCGRGRAPRPTTSKVLLGVEAEDLLDRACTSASPSAEPCALPVFMALGAGKAITVRSRMNDGRSVSALRVLQRLEDARDVLAALDDLDVPAVGLVALGGVLAQRDRGVVLDGDLVVVVDHREVAQLLGAGQRRRLGGDALLDVAVAGDHVDLVVEGALAQRGVRVEQAPLAAGGHRHADRGAEALAQRAGGDLDAGGVPVLRVAGGLAAPGAQGLEVGELQAVAREVQLDVEGEAGVPGGEHEPVAADPVGVGGVVPHDPLEQGVRQRGEAHRGAGVAVADLLHGVRGQHPHGVDGAPVQLRPVVRDARPGQRVDVGLGHGGYSLGSAVLERWRRGRGARGAPGPVQPSHATLVLHRD